jgi:hypothetical protein
VFDRFGNADDNARISDSNLAKLDNIQPQAIRRRAKRDPNFPRAENIRGRNYRIVGELRQYYASKASKPAPIRNRNPGNGQYTSR